MPHQTPLTEEWPLCEGCYYFRENLCRWGIHSTLGVDECYVRDNFTTPLERRVLGFKPKGDKTA